jgi:hypothetical protein
MIYIKGGEIMDYDLKTFPHAAKGQISITTDGKATAISGNPDYVFDHFQTIQGDVYQNPMTIQPGMYMTKNRGFRSFPEQTLSLTAHFRKY